MADFLLSNTSYQSFLQELKDRIKTAQLEAAISLNREVILLYWHVGNVIHQRCEQEGWGSKVIDQLAKDLKKAFPDTKGFSTRSLKYMRTFARTYPNIATDQRIAAQIPWGHHCVVLDKNLDPESRLWYLHQTVQHGWSRNILAMQIDTQLYLRKGAAITNFERTLPDTKSDLAQEVLKDPLNFDFLTLELGAQERDLEKGLITHIRDFLMELGFGFAFMGSQYPIVVDDVEYRFDLLFYHTRLYCYVVVDLKMGVFKPEFAGQINFYVSAVDNLIRTERDNPTIGIILCRGKKKTTVEFALQDIQKPIGVSTFKLKDELPDALVGQLPSAQELLQELELAAAEIEKVDQPDE